MQQRKSQCPAHARAVRAGDTVADFLLRLTGAKALTVGDFIL
jgi:hypothetical protein